MTNEQYETLKKYRKHLNRGLGDYVYGLYQSDFDEMHRIYKELGGNDRLKYSCQSCCLVLTKFLAKKFFEYEKELEKEKEVTIEEKVLEPEVDRTLNEIYPPETKKKTKKKTTKKAKKGSK